MVCVRGACVCVRVCVLHGAQRACVHMRVLGLAPVAVLCARGTGTEHVPPFAAVLV
jgi:hypothetical protein